MTCLPQFHSLIGYILEVAIILEGNFDFESTCALCKEQMRRDGLNIEINAKQ